MPSNSEVRYPDDFNPQFDEGCLRGRLSPRFVPATTLGISVLRCTSALGWPGVLARLGLACTPRGGGGPTTRQEGGNGQNARVFSTTAL